jgi:two-component system sensor kinase FixL
MVSNKQASHRDAQNLASDRMPSVTNRFSVNLVELEDSTRKNQIKLMGIVMLSTLIGMTLFETLKQLINPNIGIWQSHIVTIVFATCVATIAAYFALLRYFRLRTVSDQQRIIREQLERQFDECQAMEARLLKLSLAVEQSPNSILIADYDGIIEYVNPKFTENSGYSSKESVGRTPALLKSGKMPQWVFKDLWDTIKSGKTWRGDLRNRRKNGVLYWDHVAISPITNSLGEITHFLSIQTDITEHRKTEERLRESDNRVRAILETAAEGIITVDKVGTIDSFNPAAEQIFGYRRDEVIGKKIDLLIPTLQPGTGQDDSFASFLSASKGRGPSAGVELIGRRKDASMFPMELAVGEFQDGVGPFFAGILRDITERKRMEMALKEERNFIDAVLATSAALIVVLDEEGKIVRFNEACEEATGYAFGQVRGTPFGKMFLDPKEIDFVTRQLEELRTNRTPNRFESHLQAKAGERRLISWNNTVLAGNGGGPEYIIGTGIDITERRRAEIQARKHHAELAHVDRLSLMGEMATGLAHELNQPLTSIYAYSQACLRMLRAGKERSDRFVNAVEQTAQRAEHAGEIMRRIRNFVRKQTPLKKDINLNLVIEKAMKFIEAEVRDKGVTLLVDISEPLPRVSADAVQLQQVLLNLMRNSIESMLDSVQEQRIMTIKAQTVGKSSVQVTINDTGRGVNEKLHDRIFDAFYTTKANGMGMGLAISRSIIEDHGGKLWVTSDTGSGASFHFTLSHRNADEISLPAGAE